MAKHKITISTDYFLFEMAEQALALSKERAEEKTALHRVSALLLSVFALEARFNRIGVGLFPYWEDIEKGVSLGVKLDMLSHALGINFAKGERPRQSLADVIQFRNMVAHPKADITLDARLKSINVKNIGKMFSFVEQDVTGYVEDIVQIGDRLQKKYAPELPVRTPMIVQLLEE